MILGIDPGKSGGVSFVEGGEFRAGRRMPILKHGRRDVVDTRKLLDLVEAWQPTRVVVEQVGAMPGQGVTSMFNFGRHTGAVEGVAVSLGVPVNWVTPAVWKRSLGLEKAKRAALDRARLEFGPDSLWDVLANDGIAEAALMALWWERTNKD